jgi:hypothetical protein
MGETPMLEMWEFKYDTPQEEEPFDLQELRMSGQQPTDTGADLLRGNRGWGTETHSHLRNKGVSPHRTKG